jgi:pimeloyl-ACP methyl ester carboxylesterase
LTVDRAVESALARRAGVIESLHMARSAVQKLRLADGRVLCDGLRGQRVAFDLPGFGGSDAPARGSIAGYAQDVAEGLAVLGIERYTLVGHSLGGAVATALAERDPASVAALVLPAPAGFGRIHLAEAVSIPGVRNLIQLSVPMALSSRLAVTAGYMTMVTNGAAPDRGLVERVTTRGRELVAGAREGTRAVVGAGRAEDAFHRRRIDYHGPIFAIWGDRDRLVPLSHRNGVRAALSTRAHPHLDRDGTPSAAGAHGGSHRVAGPSDGGGIPRAATAGGAGARRCRVNLSRSPQVSSASDPDAGPPLARLDPF